MSRLPETSASLKDALSYRHPDADLPAQPDTGGQARTGAWENLKKALRVEFVKGVGS